MKREMNKCKLQLPAAQSGARAAPARPSLRQQLLQQRRLTRALRAARATRVRLTAARLRSTLCGHQKDTINQLSSLTAT